MIIVDETEPVGELPPPFPPRNVDVKIDEDMRTYYNLSKEIGRGRFGTVFLCNEKRTGLKFAAKFVNTKRNQDRQNVEREIEIMQTLNAERPHPRLIQLYDAFDIGKEMCLILEIVDGGELFERVIVDDFVLTERACAIFIRQICEGVEFIHSKNILHLDMKPENILCVSREGNRVKICDFGLARKYDPRKKLQVLFGTPEFVAPEVVNFEPISFGTDMWSVGVICYVLLSGLSPFMGHNYVETMTNVTHNKYDFDDDVFDDVSDEAKDFIEKLLVLDKSDRPTPAQCLRQPWLRKPPENMLHRCRIVTHSESESEPEAESKGERKEEKIVVNREEQKEEEKKEIKDIIPETKIDKEELEKELGDKDKKNRELSAQVQRTDSELELTKSNLKEFVERWNSHPNSPYLIGTPTTTVDLQKLAQVTGTIPRASFASMAVAPPSDHEDFSDFDDVEIAEITLPQKKAEDADEKSYLPQNDKEPSNEVKKEVLNIKIKKSDEEEKKKELNMKLEESQEEKKKEVMNNKTKETKEEKKKEEVEIKLKESHEKEKKEVANIKLTEPNEEEKKKEEPKDKVKESHVEHRKRKDPMIYQTTPTTRKRTRDEAKSSKPVPMEGIFSFDAKVEVRRTRDTIARKNSPKTKDEPRTQKDITKAKLDSTKPTDINETAKEEPKQLTGERLRQPSKEVPQQLPRDEHKDSKGISEDLGKQYTGEPLKRPEILALQKSERREASLPQTRRTDARPDSPADAVQTPDAQERPTKTSTVKRAPPSRDVPQKVITTVEKTNEGTVLMVSMPLIQSTQAAKIEKESSEIGSPGSSTPTRQGSRKGRSRDVVIQVAKFGDDDNQRAGTSLRQRPSRDVKLIPQKSLEKDEKGSRSRKPSIDVSPDRSRGTTPTKQRRSSREERHSSRESDRGGTPVRLPLRRPSRDVPLTPSQLDILTSLSVEAGTDSPRSKSPEPIAPQIQVWPDMIAVPQTRDETALDVGKPQSPDIGGLKKSSSTNNLDVNTVKVSPASSPIASPLMTRKQLKPVDKPTEKEPPYTAQSKLVTWILDIGTPQQRTLPFSTSDRVSQWEAKDKSPRPTDLKEKDKSPRPQEKPTVPNESKKEKSPRPQPPFSSSAQVDRSSSSTSSSESLQVQTPWGAMKRSPSRTNLSNSSSLEVPKTKPKETSEEKRQVQPTSQVSTQTKQSLQTRTTSSEEVSQESTRKSQNEPVSVNGSLSLSHSISGDKSSSQIHTRSPSPLVERRVTKSRSPTPRKSGPKNDNGLDKEKTTESSREKSAEPKKENKTSPQTTKILNNNISKSKEDSDEHSYSSKGEKPLVSGSDVETSKKKKPPQLPPIDTKKVNEAFNSDSLKRKSKFPPSPSHKKQLNVLLFSAQDRISQFEQKKEEKPSTRQQRPIVRSKTTTNFAQRTSVSEPISDSKVPSVCHQNKNSIAPPVVSSKSMINVSHVQFMRNRFMDKATKAKGALPLDIIRSVDSFNNNTPDPSQNFLKPAPLTRNSTIASIIGN